MAEASDRYSIGQQVEVTVEGQLPTQHKQVIVECLHLVMPKVFSRINKRSGLPITGLLRGHPVLEIDLGVNQQRFLTAVVRFLVHRKVHCPLPTTGHDLMSDIQLSTECKSCQFTPGQFITVSSRQPLPEYYFAQRVYGTGGNPLTVSSTVIDVNKLWPETYRQIYIKFKILRFPRLRTGRRVVTPVTKKDDQLITYHTLYPLVKSPEVANFAKFAPVVGTDTSATLPLSDPQGCGRAQA